MKTFKQIEKNTNLTGLDIYTVPNVWHVDKKNKSFYFGSIGVTVSARFYNLKDYTEEDGTTFLNKSHHNKYKVEIQHDYRDPDKINSFDYVKNGTFGECLFSDTIEEGIKKAEKYLFSSFLGLLAFKGGRIEPKNKINRLKLAKISCLHNKSMFFDHLKSDDFMLKIIKNTPEGEKELLNLVSIYNNREKAFLKFSEKLKKSFFDNFGFNIEKCKGRYTRFEISKFMQILDIKKDKNQRLKECINSNLNDKQINIIKKSMIYFNY
jgi:hypothetical protein